MEYGKIIAVTGLPGLFELLSSKNDGAILRSLEDKTTKFVSSRVHNFSHLESIEVFTVKDNVNLIEIFHAMEKAEGQAPDTKEAAALKQYFEQVFPDLDFERVYSSDLKKMLKWFMTLKDNGVELKLTEKPLEESEENENEAEEEISPTPTQEDAQELEAQSAAAAEIPAGDMITKDVPATAKTKKTPTRKKPAEDREAKKQADGASTPAPGKTSKKG